MYLLSLLLVACPAPDDDKAVDTDADTAADTDTDTDTDADAPDADRDGFSADVDCNDNDYRTNPGATELCDGADNDCDELVDEGFDVDGDGANDALACPDGTDCDDTNAEFGPDAPEVPYDGLDQDCDGADLTDVDGDSYDGGERGLDCDDEDATVHPYAEDVPKDGVDSDCDGIEIYDGDGDGHDDDAWGGDDCDDDDASVYPGRLDWWRDGLDRDCDGSDGAVASLATATVSIAGGSGSQDLVGQDVALCDLDGDARLDLVVSAPFGNGYTGQIAIFYGDNAAAWTSGMTMEEADTLIESRDQFLGFELGCGDLDADGYDDLVVGRGEIHLGTYDANFELVLWYGSGARFAATMTELDSDASLRLTLGVTRGLSTVYGRDFSVGDLDDDGAAELIVVNATADDLSEADGRFYVVGGGRYTGVRELADEASAAVAGQAIASAVPLPDMDGDGVSELLLGERGWTGTPYDTAGGADSAEADTAGDSGSDSGESPYIGRVSVVDGDGVATGWVGPLAYGFWEGTGGEQLGFAGTVGDFDGDGLQDLAVTALADATNAPFAGTVYVFAPAESAVPSQGSSADASALRGETEDAYFGYRVVRVDDLDGDGADELLISELYAASNYGRVWLMSGAAAAAGASLDDAALYAWEGEGADFLTGNAIDAGDLDGDGVTDFVIAAYGHDDGGGAANGKVYVTFGG